MVPVLHAGTPHRVSLRGFERSHPQLVCVLIREMGSAYCSYFGLLDIAIGASLGAHMAFAKFRKECQPRAAYILYFRPRARPRVAAYLAHATRTPLSRLATDTIELRS